MRRSSMVTTLLMGGLLVAACGGGEDMEEAAAGGVEMEMTAAADEVTCYIAGATYDETQDRPSPLQMVEFSYEGGTGLLCYGAPSARERAIMGGLVPYGQPWRLGANEPTTIHLTGPAIVGGVELEPGSYSLYAVPGEGEWEIFINSNWERWGIPIDAGVQSANIGSFTVEPEPMDETVEILSYAWEPMAENTMGDIVLEWENTRVSFHVHPVEN